MSRYLAALMCTMLALPVFALPTLVPPALAPQMASAPAAPPLPSTPGLLAKDALAPLIPPSVFFADKVASTQARNAAAVRLPNGKLVLAVTVDSSGYSSSIQERYQAYLITETELTIDGHRLPAGAYGCGFIANNRFVIMDIGGTELFTAPSTRDEAMRRPTPLQMQMDVKGYRLYAGRAYIVFAAPGAPQP